MIGVGDDSSGVGALWCLMIRGERKFNERRGKNSGGIMNIPAVQGTWGVGGSVLGSVITGFQRCINDTVSASAEGTIWSAESIRVVGVLWTVITLFSGVELIVATVLIGDQKRRGLGGGVFDRSEVLGDERWAGGIEGIADDTGNSEGSSTSGLLEGAEV